MFISENILKASENLQSEDFTFNHLNTGPLTLLMPTKLEAKVMLQGNKYTKFSFTVDL